MTNPDLSKNSFNEKKNFSSVILQQGKVILDSEWNEESKIVNELIRKTTRDIIGKCGTNDKNAFKIGVHSSGLYYQIYPGRYYVDGILAQTYSTSENSIPAYNQPDLFSYQNLDQTLTPCPTEGGCYIVYLDVSEKNITSIEDDEILEPALGGADTAARTKIITQIKILKISDSNTCNDLSGKKGDKICESLEDSDEWENFINSSEEKGTLTAQTAELQHTNNDPCCDLRFNSGYTGIDNSLYRVEIHNKKSFKFSDDNASTAARVTNITGTKISISYQSKGTLRQFNRGDFVELRDRRFDNWSLSGPMLKLLDVQESGEGFDLVFEETIKSGYKLNNSTFPQQFNPKVIKWKSSAIDISTISNSFKLENNIEIRFSKQDYVNESFWLIPAREKEGEIIWPRNEKGEPRPLKPLGNKHHYCIIGAFSYETGNRLLENFDLFVNSTKQQEELFKFLEEYFCDVLKGKKIDREKVIINQDKEKISIFDSTNSIQLIFKYSQEKQKNIALLQINDLIVHSFFIVEDKNLHTGKIPHDQIFDCRKIFCELTNNKSFDCVSTSSTGLLTIDFSRDKEIEGKYGPFRHELSSSNTPPAIFLGLVLEQEKEKKDIHLEQIKYLEYHSDTDYNFNFKAIDIDKEKFFVEIKKGKSRSGSGSEHYKLENMLLRFWAFSGFVVNDQKKGLYKPGEDKKESTTSVVDKKLKKS